MIDQKQYEDFCRAIGSRTGELFLQFYLCDLDYLKGNLDATVLLAYIVNTYRSYNGTNCGREQLIKSELFLPCPAKSIQIDLWMSDHRQRNAIAELVKMELIETKHSVGNALWIRLNTEKLLKIQEEIESNRWKRISNDRSSKFQLLKNSDSESFSDSHGKFKDPYLYKEKIEEKSSCSPSRPAGVSGNNVPLIPINDLDSPLKRIVSRLIQFTTKHRLLCRKVQVAKWNKDIKELLNSRTVEEVTTVQDWLDTLDSKTISDKYFPKICSASSFVEKFPKLENRMKQDEGYSARINDQTYFETIVKDGKVTKRQLDEHDERPITIRYWIDKKKKTSSTIHIEEGKPIPPWHWEGGINDRQAWLTEGV